MFLRSVGFKTAALLSLGMMPGIAAHAAAVVSTTTVLTITSPSTIYFGQNVSGNATVNSSDGSAMTGTITFYDGTRSICVISAAKAASCPAGAGMGFAVGTHVITAVYSGDAAHLGSTSNAVTVTVLADAIAQTVTTLTSDLNPATNGQGVTFVVSVGATGSFEGIPTGEVTFLDGSAVLGTAALTASGEATFSSSSLSPGIHNVTASYAGDARDAASMSPVFTETVSSTGGGAQSGFSVTVTGSTTVGVGRTAKLTVSVVAAGVYAQPVELSCADLPTEAACTFGVHTIPGGGGSTTLELSTIAPHDCGSTVPYFESAGLGFVGPAVAGVGILFLPGKRRRGLKGLLMGLIAICGLAALTGCGNCTDLGTRPGSYTIKVIGTAPGTGSSSTPGDVAMAKVKMNVILK